MSLSNDNNVPQARLCHVVKWEDFDGYGFNLHAEKGKNGQYIGKVDEGSPSEAAGLKQGDRIVEVNEIDISNETHKQVVERIKAFPNETKLLVVDQQADDYFKANNIIIKGTLPNVKVIKTPEKNPASEEDQTTNYARSIGSNSSFDESAQKSVSSTDSGSTAPTVVNNNSGIEQSRENGSRIDQDENNENNGSAGSGNGNVPNISAGEQKGLNLKMSAKELRAKLAARKKFDPKKESMDFKLKFDIVQKL
ncbi:Na(+)/H(+) exchange regulatory cofactor NHE-RF1 [Diprion similis]|uniref:Na(+)/H(+) exchange regulatory cofactor NHE-RF1 n=1 Tax=Diprion similis TaxID=362088 RepID=UPI001EF85EF6|nr:Na(+)/H(+) exchange regulatory cofactor NHE-RF1 [Diprion similis]XP_046746174.1 Na(+)/H(+) exchange regulatory cofactor NHE-RF1 [Diprion similis]